MVWGGVVQGSRSAMKGGAGAPSGVRILMWKLVYDEMRAGKMYFGWVEFEEAAEGDELEEKGRGKDVQLPDHLVSARSLPT